MCECELRMKILLIFSLCLISDGGDSKAVTGYSGGGVLIKCKYDTGYTQNKKYFCKGSPPACSKQITSEVKNKWINSGRFSLYDDTESAEFRVMIRELTVQDNGTYQCGVGQMGKDINTPVELRIKEGASGSREVTAYAGTRSNIKCTYEDEYKDKIKFFCKIETDYQCSDQIRIETKNLWTHDGRFSIHDNKSAGFVSVFIRELITEDTGTYACAVAVSDEMESYTLVKLNVTEAMSNEKSISETVPVGGDLSVSCKYPESHRSDNKFLCKRTATAACSYNAAVKENRKSVNKGKFSLYDDRERQILSVSIRNITERDSGEYWCGAEANWTSDNGYKVYFTRINLTVTGFPLSTVIAVSVSLLLLLIISLILIATVCKRCKMQGPETTTQTSGETNVDYENYPNALNFQSRQINNLSESVYQSLDSNTNQSDSTYQRLDN